MADSIEIEILEDGRVRILTGGFSAANHRNAEEIVAELERVLGAVEKKEKRKGHKHGHSHTHTHEHKH
jgi:hypothetical protein